MFINIILIFNIDQNPNNSEMLNPTLEQLKLDVITYQTLFQYIKKYTYAQCVNLSIDQIRDEINSSQCAWWHRDNSLNLLRNNHIYQIQLFMYH